MLLKDQPTFKEVVKVFIVGLALRSYITEGERRTCFGHEIARRICMAINRHRPRQRRLMSMERIKDYDIRNKQRALINQQRELGQKALEFATQGAQAKLNCKPNTSC